ncbi:alpha/beta fold hydrolase [Pelolinea submarina]|uniref:Pimeloyl-ACP methyl ester carboxylesterase n=1 Tax=Pelolinea submarina TaxID=913107 RepID=A0A347ZSG6_9CHLR|nr:alpha/beta fold hydrolase [Pelolinea submarina]REG11187.1 pimeloyl-ACP methyl ester carboxylesterase [Pelolinea submarina]BBB48247.1 hypothetical protein Pelsub_P1475 [Pelolinea submarina]
MPSYQWKDHTLFYRTQGEGPLLLILPGDTATSICYQGEIDYFSDRFRTIAPDFLGTGQSERMDEWPVNWWEQAAFQMGSLVDHLNVENCLVMGSSGGAIVALLMAIHYPEKVRAVVADSFADRISRENALENVVKDRAKKTDAQRGFWEYAQGPDWEQVVDADTAMFMKFVEAGGDCFSGRLGDVKCPVLITASKKDDAFPHLAPQIGSIVDQIEDCRAYIHAHGDHPMMWTAPDEFHAVSDLFLKKFI